MPIDIDEMLDDDLIENTDDLNEGEENPFEFKEASDDIIKLYIKSYFQDKSMYCGGPIPENELYCTDNIDLVRGIDLVGAVDVAYASLSSEGWIGNEAEECLAILKECHRKGIPKSYSGGILLMHIEFCMGYEIK